VPQRLRALVVVARVDLERDLQADMAVRKSERKGARASSAWA
jgi:hypothetical protein